MYAPRVNTFEAWLHAASTLIAAEAAPHLVDWGDTGQSDGLFADTSAFHAAPPVALDIPPALQDRLEEITCYIGEERWSLPYRVLWRCLHNDWSALMPGDTDGSRFARRERAVRCTAHAMKGFLRFQEAPQHTHSPRFVAWYEPAHNVLKSVARHFAERMGQTSWLIATPLGSANWDGRQLSFGPPLSKPALEADLIEALWLDYYRSTFTPERLNVPLMHAHLPRQYHANLPETRVMPALITEAKLGVLHAEPASPALKSESKHCQSARPSRFDLGHELEQCRRCKLWEQATYPVGGSGPSHARIMLVGEQPDDHDDLIGEPFSGELGHFLESLLQTAGLDREQVYLTHAVKHFNFESVQLQRRYRAPTDAHIQACRGWLEQEIIRLAPVAMVALGRSAAKALLEDEPPVPTGDSPLLVTRGNRRIFLTWHPGYALKAADPKARLAAQSHIVASLQSALQFSLASHA